MLTLVPELDSTNGIDVLMTSMVELTDSTTVDSTKVTVLKPTSELDTTNGIDVLMTSTVELADSTTVDGTEDVLVTSTAVELTDSKTVELDSTDGVDVLLTSLVELTDSTTVDGTVVLKPASELDSINAIDVPTTSTVELTDPTTLVVVLVGAGTTRDVVKKESIFELSSVELDCTTAALLVTRVGSKIGMVLDTTVVWGVGVEATRVLEESIVELEGRVKA